MRQGSAPNFCPPVTEGMLYSFEDESGDVVELEFLGLIIKDDFRYGFFFPVDEENPAGSSGDVVALEVLELDEDGQPAEFQLIEDEAFAQQIYEDFKEATKDLYCFE